MGTRAFAAGARRAAFTLIEIMVVVIILAVLAGALIPNLAGSMGTARLDTAAHQVADLIDYGYHAASATGRVHALVFDSDRRGFQMVAEVEPELDDWFSAVGPPRLEPVSVPGLTTRALPEGIRLDRIEVFEDELVEGEYDTIRVLFFPDGTTEFANLYLTDPSGEARLVELNGFSGAVTISRPDPETEGEQGEEYEQQ